MTKLIPSASGLLLQGWVWFLLFTDRRLRVCVCVDRNSIGTSVPHPFAQVGGGEGSLHSGEKKTVLGENILSEGRVLGFPSLTHHKQGVVRHVENFRTVPIRGT